MTFRPHWQKAVQARRDRAVERHELGRPSSLRTAPAGAVSMPVKAVDAETRRLIDEALARRAGSCRNNQGDNHGSNGA